MFFTNITIAFKLKNDYKQQNIMPYNTNGQSHAEGVRNERNIVQLLNIAAIMSMLGFKRHYEGNLQFIHQGGTQAVEDIQIKNQDGEVVGGISAKQHRNGTCDFINTSRLLSFLPEFVVTLLRETIAEIRANHRGDATQVDRVRELLKGITNSVFQSINSNNIRDLLKAIHERNPLWFLINDVANKRLLNYMHSQLTELAESPYNDENTYSLVASRGATGSRRILCNGQDTGLRLRVALNNGVKALLDVGGGRNHNSSWTLKVQWDGIDDFIETTQPYGEYSYESSE